MITDLPLVDDDATHPEVVSFVTDWARTVDKWMKPDSAVVIIPREHRQGLMKGPIMAVTLQSMGWRIFREYVWAWGQSDFYRPYPAFVNVFVMRRGNMPTQRDSEARFKDILRIPISKEDEGPDHQIMAFPVDLVKAFVKLFVPQDLRGRVFRVIDPFAGSASVARACESLPVLTTSVELNRQVFDHLAQTAWPQLTAPLEVPDVPTN